MSARKIPVRPQQKWLRALGNTRDGVFFIDAAQRIVFWNKGAEKLLGFSEAEVLYQHCYQVLCGRCCDKLTCHAGCKVHRWVLRGILPDDFDFLARTKEGKDVWLNVSTIVLPGRSKPLTVHLFRDVTHHKCNQEMIQKILSTLGLPGFPKGNPEGEKGSVKRLICEENGLSSLTRREVEVLVRLAEGLTTVAIAQRIGVSPLTVRNHVRNTLKKLGLHSKSQAISYAFTSGLV